jgi:hypothetical protein
VYRYTTEINYIAALKKGDVDSLVVRLENENDQGRQGASGPSPQATFDEEGPRPDNHQLPRRRMCQLSFASAP